MGAADANVVGGRLNRVNGALKTNEWSGHYGQNWTPQTREQFVDFLTNATGQGVEHSKW